MQAKEGFRPSYLWRSILAGRTILQKACRWRVGIGDNIAVWNDRWLVGGNNMKVRSPLVEGYENMRVRDLIAWDERGKRWERHILRQFFVQEDVDEIETIHLSDDILQDEIVWSKRKDGLYTVNSGYWVAMEEKVETEKDNMHDAGLWNQI